MHTPGDTIPIPVEKVPVGHWVAVVELQKDPAPQVVQALEPLTAKVPPPHVSQPSEVRPSALE